MGDITADVILKDIKNVHLSVYPPTGRVRISAPRWMSFDTIRLFAISKLDWIRQQQRRQRAQERDDLVVAARGVGERRRRALRLEGLAVRDRRGSSRKRFVHRSVICRKGGGTRATSRFVSRVARLAIARACR